MAKLRAERTPEDQQCFRDHSMKLERIGETLFREKCAVSMIVIQRELPTCWAEHQRT
jgi:hypothetical protein